mmetsp:Transcript_4042/g.9645  ORF Transcript_4042/g.9645 Transcript_4042/m.9645 type:complete len:528 (+) Transcript_4042:4859-6442(+)
MPRNVQPRALASGTGPQMRKHRQPGGAQLTKRRLLGPLSVMRLLRAPLLIVAQGSLTQPQPGHTRALVRAGKLPGSLLAPAFARDWPSAQAARKERVEELPWIQGRREARWRLRSRARKAGPTLLAVYQNRSALLPLPRGRRERARRAHRASGCRLRLLGRPPAESFLPAQPLRSVRRAPFRQRTAHLAAGRQWPHLSSPSGVLAPAPPACRDRLPLGRLPVLPLRGPQGARHFQVRSPGRHPRGFVAPSHPRAAPARQSCLGLSPVMMLKGRHPWARQSRRAQCRQETPTPNVVKEPQRGRVRTKDRSRGRNPQVLELPCNKDFQAHPAAFALTRAHSQAAGTGSGARQSPRHRADRPAAPLRARCWTQARAPASVAVARACPRRPLSTPRTLPCCRLAPGSVHLRNRRPGLLEAARRLVGSAARTLSRTPAERKSLRQGKTWGQTPPTVQGISRAPAAHREGLCLGLELPLAWGAVGTAGAFPWVVLPTGSCRRGQRRRLPSNSGAHSGTRRGDPARPPKQGCRL